MNTKKLELPRVALFGFIQELIHPTPLIYQNQNAPQPTSKPGPKPGQRPSSYAVLVVRTMRPYQKIESNAVDESGDNLLQSVRLIHAQIDYFAAAKEDPFEYVDRLELLLHSEKAVALSKKYWVSLLETNPIGNYFESIDYTFWKNRSAIELKAAAVTSINQNVGWFSTVIGKVDTPYGEDIRLVPIEQFTVK